MLSRAVRTLAATMLLVAVVACDKVPLTAPTESTILLFANGSSVPLTGGVELIATVTEKPGTPVQNGTLVTFTTTLGRVEPAEARTNNGRVTVRLLADGRSGTAKVTALSGGATKGELEIPVGGAAADNLALRAEPSSVSATGGTVQLIAAVRDATGNAVPGVSVTFSTTAGQLSPASATTDANGEARSSLATTRQAEVTASVGTKSAKVTVTYTAAPTIAVTVTPTAPAIGEVVTFAITVTPATDVPIRSIQIDFGDGTRTNLGASSTSASHVYSVPGTFTVRVTVTDVTGQTSEHATIIAVSAIVAVSLTATPQDVDVNDTVSFSAAVSGAGTVLQYRWNFGDGSQETTTLPNVQHIYTTTGTKVVSVSVTTSTGGTGSAQTQVRVR
jgi:adhesin/invasin